MGGTALPARPEPGTYFEIRRTWSAGDVVDLVLPMPVRLMEAHPLVEEARNQVAIQRGPIVYCLESIDLAASVAIMDVVIPRGIVLRPRHDPALLGGVTLLEGQAAARPTARWSGQLYRELAGEPTAAVDLRLIPYYAWGNRGRSEMTVWMALGR
jgi:DUF1680 family protein